MKSYRQSYQVIRRHHRSSSHVFQVSNACLGTNLPRKIPVNVSLNPTPSSEADNLFGPSELDPSELNATLRRPKIVMRSPERPPITGLFEVSVSLDESRPRGIAVEVQGAMGLDMSSNTLEEICRRGGIFGLPGRIWAHSQRS